MKTQNINSWARSWGMNVLITYRWFVLILVVAAMFAGYVGMTKIRVDTSNESKFSENDEVNQRNKKFDAIFGNEDFVFLLIEAEDVFDHDVLAYIRELSEDLEANLPFLEEITALTSVEYIDVIDGDLYVDNLIGDDIPADALTLADIKQKTLSKEVYVDRLVNSDTTATGIAIEFQEFPEYVYLPVQEGFDPLDQMKWPAEHVIMQEQIFTEDGAWEREDGAWEREDGAWEREDNAQGRIDLVKVPDPRKLIHPALRTIIDRHQHPDYAVTPIGAPVIDFEMDAVIDAESSKFLLLTLVVALIMLTVIFRSIGGVAAPFLVIVASIVSTYGLIGWIGFPMSTQTIIVAPLILVLGVSYSIHVVHHFRHALHTSGNRREAVGYAYEHASWPCFLAALTTALGFLSFVMVEIVPVQHLGVICSSGTLITYIFTMTLVPILSSFGKNRKSATMTVPEHTTSSPARRDFMIRLAETVIKHGNLTGITRQDFMTRWAETVIKHGNLTGIITVVVFVVFLGLSTGMRVESDMIPALGQRVPFVRDAVHVASHLGGIYSYEVLIELPEPDMAKDPEVLHTLEEMDRLIRTYETTRLTMSLNTLIKDINMTMHNNDREAFTIPDSRDLIAQYLLLYEMSGGEELDDWVDYDYQNLRLSVQISRNASTLKAGFAEIEAFGRDKFPAGTQVTVTGDVPIMLKSELALIDGQLRSIIVVLLAISGIMMIVLQSVRVGLLAMIPNILPVTAITGVMGLFRFPINDFTVLLAPMIIGISVDDTIHYFVHFKQEFQQWGNYRQATRETFRKVGPALIFASIILTLGFGTFTFAIINSMMHIAVLLATGTFTALLADLYITPALFVFLKPFGKVEQETKAYRDIEGVTLQQKA